MTQEEYVSDAVDLLKKLIATPSVSRNEKDAADIMEQTIRKYGFEPHREANNIWIIDPHYDESRPTLLLNAHIDTVKPVASWTRNPFSPDVEEGVLYGLGSNDCGGGLCSLLQIFRMLTAKLSSIISSIWHLPKKRFRERMALPVPCLCFRISTLHRR